MISKIILKNITDSKYHKLTNLIFMFFIAISFICLFFITYIYSNVQYCNKFMSDVFMIRNISDKIDGAVANEFAVANLDEVNKQSLALNSLIQSIDNNQHYQAFLNNRDIKYGFSELKSALQLKKDIINQYITEKSVVIEEFLDVTSNLSGTIKIYDLTAYYMRFILGVFGDLFDIAAFQNDITKARAQAEDLDYKFLVKLSVLSEQMQNVARTRRAAMDISIDDKAEQLSMFLEDYIAKSYIYIKLFVFLFATLILFLFFRIVANSKSLSALNILSRQIDYIFNYTNNSIISIDKQGNIQTINKATTPEQNHLIGTQIVFYNKQGAILDIISDLNNSNGEKKYEFLSRINESNENIFEKVFAIASYDKYGMLKGADLVLHNFSNEYAIKQNLERLKEQFDESLNIDKETKLPNYSALHEALENNPRAYLFYMGIEQFETIQFFYSSDTVLELIKEISKTIILCIDNFKEQAKLYRLQEDKFCILYFGQKPTKFAKNILEYFIKPVIVDDAEQYNIAIKIDLCFGISSDMRTKASRLTQAKLAYQKARQIEEPFFTYDTKGNNEAIYLQNQEISRIIRTAINNHGVIVECQPIFDLNYPIKDSYKLFSYEVLVRIQDSAGQIYYPGSFLDVAKQAGLYISITKAVINHTFDLIKKFEHRFSINLSSSDMSNHSIRELFLEKLHECKNPQRVTIEVLETEDIQKNMNEVNQFLEDVRKAGCHVAIDDFGSGYANIAMILQLNIDYIKIDGSIIQRLPYDEDSREFLRMLATFTKRMNYTMVAEFVKDRSILEQVKLLGVRYAQGFLLGKPIKLES